MSKSKFEFETAMKRAEEIAAAIEQGKTGLEDSIRQFEEGMDLIRKCRAVLNEAELRIQKLESSPDGGADAAGDMTPLDDA